MMLSSEEGRKMEETELLEQVHITVSDSRRNSDGYLSFLVKKNICNPWGGMEDVCRVVITMHDPMVLEFSLSTQINATASGLCSPSSISQGLTLVLVLYDGLECRDILLQEEYQYYFNGVPSGKKYIIFSEPPMGT